VQIVHLLLGLGALGLGDTLARRIKVARSPHTPATVQQLGGA
jgi:hypothetical protein